MAFSNLDVGWIEFPKIASYQQGAIGYLTVVLDSVSEYAAWCGPVHKAGSISDIGVFLKLVTAAGDLDVRVETMSGAAPSGTLWDTNTEATVSISSADNNSIKWVTLTASASVSANDWMAVKLKPNASSTANVQNRYIYDWQAGTPYLYSDTGAPAANLVVPGIYPRYSDGDLVRTPKPILFQGASSNDAFTNANVLGNKFRLPFDAVVKGFWFNGDINADATFRLYDSDGSTVLASQDVYYGVVRSAGDQYPRWMILDSDISLSAHTWYRMGLISNSATSSSLAQGYHPSGYTGLTNCWWIDPDDAYAACYHTEANTGTPTGEGSWTDTTSQVCYIGVMITEISELVAATPEVFFLRGGWA